MFDAAKTTACGARLLGIFRLKFNSKILFLLNSKSSFVFRDINQENTVLYSK
jgi:hypothetical protein